MLVAGLIGVFLGLLIAVFIYEFHIRDYKKRLLDIYCEELEKNTNNMQLLGSFRVYMEQIQELNDQQSTLIASLDQPSKNASHSKYKNTIVREIDHIEQKKIQIFNKVLKAGYDPKISIKRRGGAEETMTISQYVLDMEKNRAKLNPHKSTPTDSKNIRDKHLRLVKEKIDDTHPEQVR